MLFGGISGYLLTRPTTYIASTYVVYNPPTMPKTMAYTLRHWLQIRHNNPGHISTLYDHNQAALTIQARGSTPDGLAALAHDAALDLASLTARLEPIWFGDASSPTRYTAFVAEASPAQAVADPRITKLVFIAFGIVAAWGIGVLLWVSQRPPSNYAPGRVTLKSSPRLGQ